MEQELTCGEEKYFKTYQNVNLLECLQTGTVTMNGNHQPIKVVF